MKENFKGLTKEGYYEVTWLDITSETRVLKENLREPTTHLSKFKTFGSYYSHDDYALMLATELGEEEIDFVVIPFSNILDYKRFK
tara:strand:+ start:319 stop:573 length:255 start_codon:yes stop_codon:yes gene_type:complete